MIVHVVEITEIEFTQFRLEKLFFKYYFTSGFLETYDYVNPYLEKTENFKIWEKIIPEVLHFQ